MLPYGIVGNCKTCALIKNDGAVEWMCFPTFSSPSVFAKILDTEKGGSLEIKTKGKYCLRQRYQGEDNFGKSASAFTICSFWLIDALCYIGEVQKARQIYDGTIKMANHLGLFSEDVDLATHQQRGNFPQSYTHTAVINSSLLLSEWSAKRKKLAAKSTRWI